MRNPRCPKTLEARRQVVHHGRATSASARLAQVECGEGSREMGSTTMRPSLVAQDAQSPANWQQGGITVMTAAAGQREVTRQAEPAGTGRPADRRQNTQADIATDLAIVVDAAVTGDRTATERLLTLVRPLVLRYCRAKIGRQERSFAAADDVAQEICLAVFTSL